MPVPASVTIVGAGLAGVRIAEQLRQRGYGGAITLIGAEADPPYDRPPLSKHVLRGEREPVLLRPSYDDLDVDLRLATVVESLDPAARSLRSGDGSTSHFDTLVIATGAHARTLPDPHGRTHVLRTLRDAARLREAATPGRRAVVVGGGFIGCEVAASLRLMGLDVTIVELASAPLAPVLGDEVAARVVALHETEGVRVRAGVGVQAVTDDGVELADGTTLPADVVVVGLGVVPTVDWLRDSGIALGDGVVCNEHGRTSLSDVFALGDVAAWHDPRTGRPHRFEHWTSAVDQAAVVAATLLGEPPDSALPVPYFWSDQYKVKIQSLGVPTPTATTTLFDVSPKKALVLYGEGGILTAAVGFAAPSLVMKMRPMLGSPTPYDAAVAAARDLVSAATGAAG
jgi:3-phenylpropionate/trans-cinnamate dioxygenase ferredoxin reductase subunit